MRNQKNETVTLMKGTAEIQLNYADIRKGLLVLRAMNHPLRQEIIKILEEESLITVTDLFIKMRLEQSVVSQHLAILRSAKIVNASRQGKFIYYSLNFKRIQEVNNLAKDLAS